MHWDTLYPLISLGVVINLTFAAIANITSLFPYTYALIVDVNNKIAKRADLSLPDSFLEDPASFEKLKKAKRILTNLEIGYKSAIGHSLSHSLAVFYGLTIIAFNANYHLFDENFHEEHLYYFFHMNILFLLFMLLEVVRIIHILMNRKRRAFRYLIDGDHKLEPHARFFPSYYFNRRGIIASFIIVAAAFVLWKTCCTAENQQYYYSIIPPIITLNLYLILLVKITMNANCRLRIHRICRRLNINGRASTQANWIRF